MQEAGGTGQTRLAHELMGQLRVERPTVQTPHMFCLSGYSSAEAPASLDGKDVRKCFDILLTLYLCTCEAAPTDSALLPMELL
jgi:hypothetical protein